MTDAVVVVSGDNSPVILSDSGGATVISSDAGAIIASSQAVPIVSYAGGDSDPTILVTGAPGGGGGVPPAFEIEVADEGNLKGSVGRLNFAGAGVAATVTGSIATITVLGGTTGAIENLSFDAGGTGATAGATFDGSSPITISWNSVGAQQADANLSAIAALATASYGRGLLTLADTAALTAQVGLFSDSSKGSVPPSGGGTVNYLRADGTWSAPPFAPPGPIGSSGLTMGTARLLGRVTSASGAIEELTPTAAKSFLAIASSDVSFVQAGVGTAPRTSQDKLRDLLSVPDFTSHANADVAGTTIYVPVNVTSTRANGASLLALSWGPGRVTTADGNKRGKWFANVTAAPASVGNHNSIDTAFNGDLSHSHFQIEHRITGAGTLGTPASGYLYTPEVYPIYIAAYNSSGSNASLSGNGGRTAAVGIRVFAYQAGQGDFPAFNASVTVASVKAGATHFLASPAGSIVNGDMIGLVNYAYLNSLEFLMSDNGTNDIAALGPVIRMNRTITTGGLSCWWGAFRVISEGSGAINNLLSAVGKVNTAIDLAMTSLDLGTNAAAISLKAGQRIYFNNASSNDSYTTAFNGWYAHFNASISAIQFVANGNDLLQIKSDMIALRKPPLMPVLTSSTLPGASGNAGLEAYITDSSVTTRGSNAAGGGTSFAKIYSDGTTWKVA